MRFPTDARKRLPLANSNMDVWWDRIYGAKQAIEVVARALTGDIHARDPHHAHGENAPAHVNLGGTTNIAEASWMDTKP